MKHLFAITILLLAACGWAFGDLARDERECHERALYHNREMSARTTTATRGTKRRSVNPTSRRD